MGDWTALETMKDAHGVGLRRLDQLSRAVEKLREGEKTESIEVFQATVRFFEDDLAMHFRHEEQALFPALAKVIGRAGPIEAMVEEHDSLWRVIDTFSDLVPQLSLADTAAEAKLVPALERAVHHIVWALTSHIQKEDSMLFPLADKTLDQDGKREVDENMATLERLYGIP